MRILAVDDDIDLADILAEVLGFNGHEVLIAHTVDDALALAHTHRPELVLLDVNLRSSDDGLGLTRRLRADPATAGAHIVAMTGSSSAAMEAQARNAGVDEIVRKPVPVDVLEALVNRATESRNR
jgi:DNA-binding response OmpR family regulator